jgi:hypothetical protein
MNNLPPVMLENDETEQQPKSDGRNHKQVDGGDAVGMVPQECQPPL